MNYNSWKRKYPLKPFPHKLEKFSFFGKPFKNHLLAIQIQKAHQTAIKNYGATVFFGNSYAISPTTISYSMPIENITFTSAEIPSYIIQ